MVLSGSVLSTSKTWPVLNPNAPGPSFRLQAWSSTISGYFSEATALWIGLSGEPRHEPRCAHSAEDTRRFDEQCLRAFASGGGGCGASGGTAACDDNVP